MGEQPPDFDVTRHREGAATIVRPVGEVDLATVDAVRGELLAAAGEASRVVLDLREVTFMDSSALRLVVELQRRSEADGFAFVLVRGPASMRRLLELSGVEGRIRAVDDVEQATGDGSAGA